MVFSLPDIEYTERVDAKATPVEFKTYFLAGAKYTKENRNSLFNGL